MKYKYIKENNGILNYNEYLIGVGNNYDLGTYKENIFRMCFQLKREMTKGNSILFEVGKDNVETMDWFCIISSILLETTRIDMTTLTDYLEEKEIFVDGVHELLSSKLINFQFI